MPIIAGTGAASTRESIQLCKDAADAGADYVMVIPPGYYSGALVSNSKAIEKFCVVATQHSSIGRIMLTAVIDNAESKPELRDVPISS